MATRSRIVVVVLLLAVAPVAAADTAPASCDGALAPNEPMYLVVGGRDERTARLQLSFEYRLFCDDSAAVREVSWAERLHFGYTQTTLWDLAGESRPFRDNTFRPSIYWQDRTLRTGARPDFLRGGYEHESNGRDGDLSRNVNILFVQAGWILEHGRQRLLIAPKWRIHLNASSENRDITAFRGHVDLHVEYGRDDSWLASAMVRRGDHGYGSVQLEVSYPLHLRARPRSGAFVYFQAFHGYGETLLDFNRDSGTQLRAGFAIVR